jgi:hypothetical protein
MDTSQYEATSRKQFKRDQRTPAYRDLQKRSAEARAQLETALRARNEAVTRLTNALVAAGIDAEAVAKLAA